MELIYRADLTYSQQKAMFEYLDVPKGIRHYNPACVAEQLKKVRKKAKEGKNRCSEFPNTCFFRNEQLYGTSSTALSAIHSSSRRLKIW